MPIDTPLGLSALRPNEPLSSDDYAFGFRNPFTIDRYLQLFMRHRHDGATVEPAEAPIPPTLTEVEDEGLLPANTRIYYKVSTVDDDGFESPASASNFLTTSAGLDTFVTDESWFDIVTSGGALPGGVYQYLLTAWVQSPAFETDSAGPITAQLPYAYGNEQQVTIDLPALPSGAEGFNIYRRAPGAVDFYRIGSVTGAALDDPFVDASPDIIPPFEKAPITNVSSYARTVRVTRPSGATTWRIYRSLDDSDWTASFVAESTASTYNDTGTPTQYVSPPVVGLTYQNPEPVAGVELSEVATTVEWSQAGAAATGALREQLVAYEGLHLAGLVLGLDQGTTPTSGPMTVAIEWWDGAAWTAVLSASIASGNSTVVVDASTATKTVFAALDRLRANVTAVGTGGTNLQVHLRAWARVTPAATDWTAPDWS